MKEKVDAGIKLLREQGHNVETKNIEGRFVFPVDNVVQLTWEEMADIGDGYFTFEALCAHKRAAQKPLP